MKICMISNLYPPYHRGGAGVVVKRTVDELINQGHEVIVISAKPFAGISSLKPELESSGGEQIYRFYPLNLYFSKNDHKFPLFIRAIWHLIDVINPINGWNIRSILKKEKSDVVITHNLKGIGLSIPLFLRDYPHVHVLHDVQLVEPSGLIIHGEEQIGLLKGFFRKIQTGMSIFIFRFVDLVISPTQFLFSFYKDHKLFTRSNTWVHPNPAPELSIPDHIEKTGGVSHLYYIGQIEEHKGIRFLVDAIKSHPDLDLNLSVVGKGSLSDWLNESIKDESRIDYRGFLEQESFSKILASSDATIIPSLCYENSPTAVYESLQAGIPVIAANIGGLPELIREGKNGYTFEPGNVESLLAAIKKTKETVFSKQHITSTVSELSIKHYVKDLVAHLNKLVK